MRCLALFNGSLDSALAARLVERQGIEVELVYFPTFCAAHAPRNEVVAALGCRLTTIPPDAAHCRAVCHPVLGRGKGASACLDCRVWMLRAARERMEQTGADFVVTGEVLGQRPHSQNRPDLEAVEYHAGLEGRLLRPLSAQLLPETIVERDRKVDRTRLGRFHGNSRRQMEQRARELGLPPCPASQTGCALTDRALSARFFDLVEHSRDCDPPSLALLRIGRHFRVASDLKIVVGRNSEENTRLRELAGFLEQAAVIEPANFVGPTALAVGPNDEADELAASLILRHSRALEASPLVDVTRVQQTGRIKARHDPRTEDLTAIGSTPRTLS